MIVNEFVTLTEREKNGRKRKNNGKNGEKMGEKKIRKRT